MPYIKDTYTLLAECAANDLPDTKRVVRESELKSDYEKLEELQCDYEVYPEMVTVVELEGAYYTEASFMAPFMRDAGIKSFAEALDVIAESNGLPAKSVGLLIESDGSVSGMLEKACKTENSKLKDKAMEKVDKATQLVKNLKKKGYPVKKKKNKK